MNPNSLRCLALFICVQSWHHTNVMDWSCGLEVEINSQALPLDISVI